MNKHLNPAFAAKDKMTILIQHGLLSDNIIMHPIWYHIQHMHESLIFLKGGERG